MASHGSAVAVGECGSSLDRPHRRHPERTVPAAGEGIRERRGHSNGPDGEAADALAVAVPAGTLGGGRAGHLAAASRGEYR